MNAASAVGRTAAGPPARAIERTAILDRLEGDRTTPLTVIVAPAGFGKTTLMLQWGERVGTYAYLRLTEIHGDPAVLMHDLADALMTIEPLPGELIERLLQRSLEPGLQAASRLAEAMAGFSGSAILLLDDIHVLGDQRATDALRVFVRSLPPSLRVAAAGHDGSVFRLGWRRAIDQVIEVGEADLAFREDEVRAMAHRLGVTLRDGDAPAILTETLGWPVAVSLALHSLEGGDGVEEGPSTAFMVRSVADYIRVELLDPLEAEERSWLVRSSALDVMSGPLCDSALEVTGSLARLRRLARSSLLVQPVDAAATRYRYHPLLRGQLRDELDLRWPGDARAIAVRAAAWCDEQGDSLGALEYARLAEDRELMARLVTTHVWSLHWKGQTATLQRWVAWFDRDGLRDRYPALAVLAGFILAIDGQRHAAEVWLAAAQHSSEQAPMPEGSSREAWVAMLRGMMMPEGPEGLEQDARLAVRGMRPDSSFMPGVRLLTAVASMLAARSEEATEHADEALELAEARGAMPGFALASGIRASLALRAGQDRLARRIVEHAIDVLRVKNLTDYVLCCLIHAVAARVAIATGSKSDARHHLAHVHRLRPLNTAALPWLSVLTRLEAMEALLALGDVASARTLMREVDEILRVRPRLGSLATDAEAMRARLDRVIDAGSGLSTLTAAELRVLQYLPTHLTFSEISERLYVSPHTVKSQAVAIYGKLGVSSRRAAIETAVELGLLDGSALRFPLGPGVDSGIG